MKYNIFDAGATAFGWFIRLVVVALLLSGCSAVDGVSGFLVRKSPTVVRAGRTNIIERTITNYVAVTTYVTNLVTLQAASTNAAGAITPAILQPQVTAQTSTVPVLHTSYEAQILPAVVVTNLSLAPTVSGAVSVAGDLAPVPWASGAANVLLAVAGGVFGWINHRRANKALGEKETWQSAATVGVHSVEQIRAAALKIPGYTPEIDKQVMQAIVGMQYAAGVKTEIGEIVDKETGFTLGAGRV